MTAITFESVTAEGDPYPWAFPGTGTELNDQPWEERQRRDYREYYAAVTSPEQYERRMDNWFDLNGATLSQQCEFRFDPVNRFAYSRAWSPETRGHLLDDQLDESWFLIGHSLSIFGAESTSRSPMLAFSVDATIVDSLSSIQEVTLFQWLRQWFDDAKREAFFDGMDSVFRRRLHLLIRCYGDMAIDAVREAIDLFRDDEEVVDEALRQLGLLDDDRTHYSRMRVLIQELESDNPRIRDAASIGIAALDDPLAVDSIRKAMVNEQFEDLRQSFKEVLEQLQAN